MGSSRFVGTLQSNLSLQERILERRGNLGVPCL